MQKTHAREIKFFNYPREKHQTFQVPPALKVFKRTYADALNSDICPCINKTRGIVIIKSFLLMYGSHQSSKTIQNAQPNSLKVFVFSGFDITPPESLFTHP